MKTDRESIGFDLQRTLSFRVNHVARQIRMLANTTRKPRHDLFFDDEVLGATDRSSRLIMSRPIKTAVAHQLVIHEDSSRSVARVCRLIQSTYLGPDTGHRADVIWPSEH